MAKNLVIVESPAKAKTIEKFLGADYTVRSSYGHVRDLAKDGMSVDVENNFEPKYEISADKKKVIYELKKLAKDAEIIWLATDEDREGEAISWHLVEALKLDESKTKRIVFHEITKPAITKAIQNPRKIDRNLVNAQQARRVLDRLVGFELSPVLWKKVRPSLSAGRVQSVAVRLIVEREREIIGFEPEISFKPKAKFTLQNSSTLLPAELVQKFDNYQEALAFCKHCQTAQYQIENIEVKPGKKTPAAPFTTSTLQQEASRKLGFSVSKTMTLAQKLYEAGHITYMRTDSVNLSELAINAAYGLIVNEFGEKYAHSRNFTTKSKSAQEAHEAIRPTYLQNAKIDGSYDEKRLYDLIWKRTVASQMADAELEKTSVKISVSNRVEVFQATGNVVKFEGFLKVYNESTDDDDETNPGDILLPPLAVNETLGLDEIICRERFSRPPARYTEAALVKKLEELGIGRPSTYAPTISTVQKRNYVVKESRDGSERNYKQITVTPKTGLAQLELTETFGAEKNKLFPSDIGMLVTDFLTEHFETVMDYNFTASVENEFDNIAQGLNQWQAMLEGFYGSFHSKIEETTKADRAKQERQIGMHPESGEPIYARLGKYGPFVQLGETSDDIKPKYAKLRAGQLIETITLPEALELFKLPRQLGNFEDKVVTADIGRFGPYVRHNSKFVSIPKDLDPYEIDLESAINLIKQKREDDANKFINEFEHQGKTIQILNGRWGPYIKEGKTNYKIPKGTIAETLTLDEILKIMDENPPKKKGGRSKK
ncbi:MAG: type I DNA topoisomerase [Bacteroidetes bacterium]|nr:type I DNA topoisomerase [Bacteroidota bacterium]